MFLPHAGVQLSLRPHPPTHAGVPPACRGVAERTPPPTDPPMQVFLPRAGVQLSLKSVLRAEGSEVRVVQNQEESMVRTMEAGMDRLQAKVRGGAGVAGRGWGAGGEHQHR